MREPDEVKVAIEGEFPQGSGLNRTVEQVFTLFILPELARRHEAGTLDPSFIQTQPSPGVLGVFRSPSVALVILEENRPLQVLFDGEAGAEFKMRVKGPIELGQERPFNEGEIAGFRLSNLPENAGWVLLYNQNGQIGLAFDFRRNRAFAVEHRKLGESFLKYALGAMTDGESRVCVELLFHAAEKLCKAVLLTLPLGLRGQSDDKPLERKHHPDLRNLYQNVANDDDGARLLKDIAELRNKATYFLGRFEETGDYLADLLKGTEALRDSALSWVPDDLADTPMREWELPAISEPDRPKGT